jgi:excisionase family DNA binding protein
LVTNGEKLVTCIWLDEQEVAVRFGVSISTVQRMRRQGTLKAKLIGRRWKVSLDWLLEFEAAPDNQCPKNNSESDHTSSESGQTARVGAPAGSILRLDKHDVHLSAQKIFKRPSFGSRNMSQKKKP